MAIKIVMDVQITTNHPVVRIILVPFQRFECQVFPSQFVTNENSLRIMAENRAIEQFLCQLENKFMKEDPEKYKVLEGKKWSVDFNLISIDWGIK